MASWAGFGLGKPSGSGNFNGVAATRVAATEMTNIIVEEVKYMMRMKSGSSRKLDDIGMELLEK